MVGCVRQRLLRDFRECFTKSRDCFMKQRRLFVKQSVKQR